MNYNNTIVAKLVSKKQLSISQFTIEFQPEEVFQRLLICVIVASTAWTRMDGFVIGPSWIGLAIMTEILSGPPRLFAACISS